MKVNKVIEGPHSAPTACPGLAELLKSPSADKAFF